MEGQCPNCKSNNLSYGETELEGNSLGYHFVCDDCKKSGMEWYDLNYSESTIDELTN